MGPHFGHQQVPQLVTCPVRLEGPPVDKAMASVGPCTHVVDPREEVTGHLGEQIFESPFPSSVKALCSPCQLSSSGLALTSPSQGFGGLKLHPSLFLGCLHALSSLTSKASVTVSAMCSFQCCVHIVSCSILTPCQPWMSPIH